MADLVIGSGPTGVAVASALLARGREVQMIDGGETLEPAARERRTALAGRDPADWSPAEVAAYQHGQFAAPPGSIRRYGSDFAIADPAATFDEPAGNLALRASRATGGLSNLWGAAVLPYAAGDIADWPVTAEDLTPHYAAVKAMVGATGASDDLSALFSDLPPTTGTIAPSPQAGELLRRAAQQRPALHYAHLRLGVARQAVDTACRACGMCLHGCPWGYIWHSGKTLELLRENPKFSHRPWAVARRFDEGPATATVHLDSGEALHADRVFIAAGVLPTAAILLASRPDPGELILRDSQHAFLPMLHRWRTPRPPDRLPYHTLPQLFAELSDPAVSPYLVHAQIYTWNEYFAREMVQNYAHGLPGAAAVLRQVAKRLMVAQIFLHSAHSGRLRLTAGHGGRLRVTVEENPQTLAILKQSATALGRSLRRLGAHPLGFALRPGGVGSSFHTGGSVPMATRPGPGQSDIFGRPRGFVRTHIVDASVLPSIAATTITLTAMANAHRIGTYAPLP